MRVLTTSKGLVMEEATKPASEPKKKLVVSDGTTSGMTSGTSDKVTRGTTSDGTASDGTTSDGTTNDGTTSDGTTSDGKMSGSTSGTTDLNDSSNPESLLLKITLQQCNFSSYSTKNTCKQTIWQQFHRPELLKLQADLSLYLLVTFLLYF